ncbi:class B sortase [Lachnospiraceae bacterium KGMB03038]|nr:class B sortase [Lachnospiraceae bacterium KGMB03038]
MAEANRKKRHRRGRRRKRKGGVLSNLILAVAIVVFCVSGFQLIRIGKGYLDGRSEYEKVRDVALTNPDEQEGFRVDFEELMKSNPDTVGWIRFYPEPSQISYPIVQGEDNERYLHETFSANENTLGAIFLNVDNSADYSDKNTIIYGHRMRDGSMFRHLQDYEDESFWKDNPYFYIYTPDGKEITYHIYSYAVVNAVSDTYLTEFGDDESYQEFLDMTMETSEYDTGVEVDAEDTIVTLSTCTSASDENRIVVRGVKEKEVELKE